MQKIQSNKSLLLAAQGQAHSRYPVWFFRQAGRYLPEYRELRSKTTFLGLCENPKLAAEVTLQPLRRYDLDGAIIFADILLPLQTMGQALTFAPDHGPLLSPPVRSAADIKGIKVGDAGSALSYVGEAISIVRGQLASHQTMLGFIGAPLTVGSYMIEGGSSSTYEHMKRLAFNEPEAFRDLLEKLAETLFSFAKMQIAAGAEVMVLFDTWATQWTGWAYRHLALPVTRKLVQAIKAEGVPVVYYPGQGAGLLTELGDLGADMISVDWRVSLRDARSLLGQAGVDVPLQGNLDPLALLGDERFVREQVRRILEEARSLDLKGHIFNVGHGLLPVTPPESLVWVVDEVRKFV